MDDNEAMATAVEVAAAVRATTSPNPWVGCVVEAVSGEVFTGATERPGGRHAEVVAIDAAKAAGASLVGATVWVTLEPCSHTGRTPPCVELLIEMGVGRVVVGMVDPDPRVEGNGLDRLAEAGIDVTVGVQNEVIKRQLAPYVKHRTTGRPWVVLKLASSLDGRTAAPDQTSRWITGGAARADAHQLRAESDAIAVGSGTVRTDDPSLTVRHVEGHDPLRVVLGHIPPEARVQPAISHTGELDDLLENLGDRGVVQLLVEGGATVAGRFHRAGLVDQYVIYVAPVLFGGDDARPLFAGDGAATMDDVWRGSFARVMPLGSDLRIDLTATSPEGPGGAATTVRAAEVAGPLPDVPATSTTSPLSQGS